MKTQNLYSADLRQQGFTLVELMVSMAIGLVIVLFVTSMYISSRGSQRLTDDNMRVQEESQMAMNLLGRNLMQAGFSNLTAYKNVVLTGKGLTACDNGFSNPSDASDNPACATAGAPGFQVRYQVDKTYDANTGAAADCNGKGSTGTSAATITNRFYIATKTGETTPSLYCSGSGDFTSPQPLLGNVEDMRLTYVVDADSDSSADTFYTNASNVAAFDSTWKSVVSVDVCLLISSDNNVTPGAQTYTDCNGATQTSTDRKLRTTVHRLFTLRNNAASSNQ